MVSFFKLTIWQFIYLCEEVVYGPKKRERERENQNVFSKGMLRNNISEFFFIFYLKKEEKRTWFHMENAWCISLKYGFCCKLKPNHPLEKCEENGRIFFLNAVTHLPTESVLSWVSTLENPTRSCHHILAKGVFTEVDACKTLILRKLPI